MVRFRLGFGVKQREGQPGCLAWVTPPRGQHVGSQASKPGPVATHAWPPRGGLGLG